jgi:hypothetical protein
MPIELYWDNDERDIMLIEVEGAWTWDDLYTTLGKIRKVTDNASYTIGAILDVSGGTSVPGGTIFTQTAFNHAREMLKMGEGGTGPIMIVGANSFIRMVFSTFYNLDRKTLSNVRFAASLEEARLELNHRLSSQRTGIAARTAPA